MLKKFGLSTLAAFFLLGLVNASPASAEESAVPTNTIYTVTKALKKNNVYLMEGAELSMKPEIEKKLKGSKMGIVVLPSSEKMKTYDEWAEGQKDKDGYEVDSFAELIYSFSKKNNYKNIVILSKNRFTAYGSTVGIDDLLAGTNARNTEKILLNHAKIEDHAEITRDEWVPVVLWIVGIVGGLIGLVVFACIIENFNAARKKNKKAKADKAWRAKIDAEREAAKQAKLRRDAMLQEISPQIPKELATKLDNIQNWSAQHIVKNNPDFAKKIAAMVQRFQILFERIHERGTPQQRDVAMVGYKDMLDKITAALSERYYLDILKNPELWDDPQERIAQVEDAVEGTSLQLLENIKQVNASRDLDFKASLERLAGFLNNPSLEDIYGKKPKR